MQVPAAAEETKAPPPPAPPSRFSGWRVLNVFAALASGATAAGYLGWLWWPLENLGVFQVQCATFLGLGALAYFLGKRRKTAAVCLAFALLSGAPLLTFYFRDSSAPAGGGAKLTILCANVHTGNRDVRRTIDYINATDADIVVLMEVDSGWLAALAELHARYPHRTTCPRSDNFGIALFSRIPPTESRIRYFGDAGAPSIVATLPLGERPLTLLATHPVPPINSQYVFWRNQQMREIAAFCRATPGPLALVGDLNMTANSPAFRGLLADGNLRDSRKGFGLQPTWPATMPLLLVTLDHCLISPNVCVERRNTGPDIGSDHYPVFVELSLPPQ